MKYKLLFFILLVFNAGYAQSEKLDDNKVANINCVINLFKQINIEKISKIIAYPLERQYPIPSIKNENEFKQRFYEVFDETFIKKIANSKIEQWQEVGWRGICLDNGDMWVESDDGKIIAINYQTSIEKKLRQKLIDSEKEVLHISLKIFESPIFKIKTKNYLIRIDKLSNGKYRYASWKQGKTEFSEPDIILNNGKIEFLGSGGNHQITFQSGNYTYNIFREIIGDGIIDATLTVEKDGQIILTENGILIMP